MTDATIGARAIIRKAQFKSNGSKADGYRIVVRWFLYEKVEGSEDSDEKRAVLPRVIWDGKNQFVADTFQLSLMAHDGTKTLYFSEKKMDFVDTVQPVITVKPILDAMVRAPSRRISIYPASLPDFPTDKVAVATCSREFRPVQNGKIEIEKDDPDDPDFGGYALTIRDILYDSDPACARAAQFTALRQVFTQEIELFRNSHWGGDRETVKNNRDDFLRGWANGRPAPDHAADLAEKCLAYCDDRLFNSVRVLDAIQAERNALARAVQSSPNYSDAARLSDLAVISRALAHAEGSGTASLAFLEALDDQKSDRETAREALSVSSSQGGRWFVYEAKQGDDDPLADVELDSPLGQAMPNELAGLGWMSKVVDEATAQRWMNYSSIGIEIVPHFVLIPAGNGQVQAPTGRYFVPDEQRTASKFSHDRMIERAQLQLLDALGSTHPLKPPSEAVLLLDKVQSSPVNEEYKIADNLEPKEEAREEYHTPTNDTMVRIRMRSENLDGAGFVLYSQWRSQNELGGPLPALDEIRSYAVNQRTSFMTDIFHAYELDTKDPVNDHPHERVKALVAHPPINPIVPRLTETRNAIELRQELRTANDSPYADEEIDAITPYDLASDNFPHGDLGDYSKDSWVNFDLRLGTLQLPAADWTNYDDWVKQLGVRWDPNAPVNSKLTGKTLARAEVDKYRILVGCIDMFGQESAVVPVETHIEEVGGGLDFKLEAGDYVPRQRRALKGPPRIDVVNDRENRALPGISYSWVESSKSGRLEITFTTPQREAVGVSTSDSELEDPTKLTAYVRIYRRFLRGATEGIPRPSISSRVDEQTDVLDAWQRKQGFTFFGCLQIAEPTNLADNIWSATANSFPLLQLPPSDHGFEYRAAIRFERKQEVLKYFMPDRDDRPHHRLKSPESKDLPYELETHNRSEIHSKSYYELTDIAPAQTQELKPDNPVAHGAWQNSAYIQQIGSAGSVSRDLVLSNLLSRAVKDSQISRLKLWPPEPKSPDPASSRIGNWDAWKGPRYYTNVAQVAVMEAAMIRAGCKNFQPQWRPFVELLLRDFARVSEEKPTTSDTDPLARKSDMYDIIGLRGYVSLRWQADTSASARVPPADFVIYLQRLNLEPDSKPAREQVWVVRADDPATNENRGIYEYILPVPGGPAEKLSWSIVARSSVMGESEQVVLLENEFVASRVPFPLAELSVAPVPWNDSNALPPNADDYIPKPFKKPEYEVILPQILRKAPRLALNWNWTAPKHTSDKGVYVLIIKEREQWAGSSLIREQDDDTKPLRDVLAQIAAVSLEGQIEWNEDLAQILTPWLDGKQDANLPKEELSYMFPWPAKAYIPVAGLGSIADPDTKFLDYFFNIEPSTADTEKAMEYTHRYSYSIATYIELPGLISPNGHPPRYLISELTDFSVPRIPDIPDWVVDVSAKPSDEDSPDLVLPTIKFDLSLEDARVDLGLDSTLAFHCVIVRKLRGALNNSVTHFVPFGRPVILSAGSAKDTKSLSAHIDAGEIARKVPHAQVDLECELRIGLMLQVGEARIPLGSVRRIELPLLTVARPSGANEKRIEKKIRIKLGG